MFVRPAVCIQRVVSAVRLGMVMTSLVTPGGQGGAAAAAECTPACTSCAVTDCTGNVMGKGTWPQLTEFDYVSCVKRERNFSRIFLKFHLLPNLPLKLVDIRQDYRPLWITFPVYPPG